MKLNRLKQPAGKVSASNAAVLVWSPDTLQQVRFTLKDFKNDKNKLTGKNNITLDMISYDIANYPYGAKDVTCGESVLIARTRHSYSLASYPGYIKNYSTSTITQRLLLYFCLTQFTYYETYHSSNTFCVGLM